jgi:hypothetical protein
VSRDDKTTETPANSGTTAKAGTPAIAGSAAKLETPGSEEYQQQ